MFKAKTTPTHISPLIWLAIFIFWSSCERDEPLVTQQAPPAAYSADIPLAYHELFLDLERFTDGYRPPVSARAAAHLGLIGYETLVSAMPEHNSMLSYYNISGAPTPDPGLDYHWPVALTEAYTVALEYFFPEAPAEYLFRIYGLRTDFFQQYRPEVPREVFSRSVVFGREMAQAICAWSATDTRGHEAYLHNTDPSYQPPGGTGRWQPTYPDFLPALLPYWGEVRTFAADDSDVVADPLPYDFSPTSAIYEQAEQVMELVNSIKAGEDEEELWIAQFWSDDCPILTFTPAGRWVAIANQLVHKHPLPLSETVELYARLGVALNDAGVRCWHEKYRFSYLRPIDYIREVMPGQENWNTVMCPDGSGNYFTPNFPAYPSGHAAFGAAAAKVLEYFWGLDRSMTDHSHETRTEFNGTARRFESFQEMAEENAYSRIPLGVHFQMDSDEGLRLGFQIGEKVNALPWKR